MEKRYSQVLGLKVISQANHKVLGRVANVLLNTDKGLVAAFFLSLIGDRIVIPVDILELNNAIVIHSEKDIVRIDEVQRVSEVKEKGQYILTKKVYTESGIYLGRVFDFSFDTKEFRLKKIYANKVFLWILFPQKSLIDARHIIDIQPRKVIVRDAVVQEIEMTMNKSLTTNFN